MTENAISESGPLYDRPQVRIFTLADYVAEEPSGRLYVSGAGLEWLGIPIRPTGKRNEYFLSCYVLLRLAFPRMTARAEHRVEVQARTSDGVNVGQDSLFRVEMHFDLEDVPEDFAEVSGNLPVQVTNFRIRTTPDTIIFLHLLVDDVLISRLPAQFELADG